MEAQGELLADYYALRFLGVLKVKAGGEARSDTLADYEQVLSGFLDRPAEKVHLPRMASWPWRQA